MAIKFSPAEALAYAQASQRIEGRQMSPEAVDITLRMLRGEITHSQAVAEIIESAKLRALSVGARPQDS